jgi:hypothetical protein
MIKTMIYVKGVDKASDLDWVDESRLAEVNNKNSTSIEPGVMIKDIRDKAKMILREADSQSADS